LNGNSNNECPVAVNDLQMQFATKFRLVVNLKAAEAIGLTIPEPFLLRADEVIQ
jgi:putative tryptophan/tyrosine transport system substrate-binding protein